MNDLTHVNDHGQAHMVNVGAKVPTARVAVARGSIAMNAAALAAIRNDDVAKGDVLATARIAGIMAAKNTSALIPLCHPIAIESVAVDFEFTPNGVIATATVSLSAKTGVEMEAMVAASIALLTIYDMAKAVDKGMIIGDIKLISKTGGKSGDWRLQE